MSNNTDLGIEHKKTVLIIEDSPIQALALVQLMESAGLNAICASNGLAGISMARFYLPDLIILDIQMPEMDGLEACHVIKQDRKTTAIPIILLTGLDQNQNLVTGVEAGAVDFIPKDAFSEVVLLETMRQLSILPPVQSTFSSQDPPMGMPVETSETEGVSSDVTR